MTEIVVGKFEGAGRATSKPDSVGEKRVRDGKSGKLRTVRTLSGQSETFGSDLGYVFSRNVAAARRENKRMTGSLDSAVVES